MQTNNSLLNIEYQESNEMSHFSIWELLRHTAQLLVVAIGCILALVLLWPVFEKGEQLKREIELKDKIITDLEKQRDGIYDEYQALLNDPVAIEREARDLLNLAREGEVIFRFTPYEIAPASRSTKQR